MAICKDWKEKIVKSAATGSMAYIPPHKRHSGGARSLTTENSPTSPTATPIPESLSPHFKRTLNFRSFSDKKKSKDRSRGGLNIVYAPKATSTWFPVGLDSCFDCSDDDDNTQFMSLIKLQPFSLESYERKFGAKPRALLLNHDRMNEYGGDRRVLLENPWEFVAENLKQDLLSAMQRVK